MNIVYINLDHRTDRKNSIETQFAGITGLHRFNAVRHDPGYIGCSLSHIGALQMAKERGWDNVIILEDDFELLVPIQTFVEKIEQLMREEWDVCLISCYLRNVKPATNSYARVISAQAASGYIVKSHYYDTLLQNYTESCNQLKRGGIYSKFALDQYWKILQPCDKWIVSIPILGKQSASYSDIELRNVNYDSAFITSPINRHFLP
jgi:GR25 family glycosyltransferase involved in LPS biosynthesis